jgi:MinD superfamily P-loop ATPase
MATANQDGQVREILIISGKGGTGKTTVTAAFAGMAGRVVLVDCDVDAPNLHLLVQSEQHEAHLFLGMPKPRIDTDKCRPDCSLCAEVCRFTAINGRAVDELACEACGVCAKVCPTGAITMEEHVAGNWYVSSAAGRPFLHAELAPAEENSGKLVTLIRRRAREIAKEQGIPLILTDGPPGIGCAAISALSGVDLVLLVAEPTVSGWHDLRRALELVGQCGVEPLVAINKADLHERMAREIEWRCYDEGVVVCGHIPYDENLAAALAQGKPFLLTAGRGAQALAQLWHKVQKTLAEIEQRPAAEGRRLPIRAASGASLRRR